MIGRHVLVSKCLPDDMDTAVLKLRISCHCIEKDREMKNKKEKRSGNGDAFSLSRDGFLFPSFLAAMANGANLSPICHPRCITMEPQLDSNGSFSLRPGEGDYWVGPPVIQFAFRKGVIPWGRSGGMITNPT
jgi:hypothetical protein